MKKEKKVYDRRKFLSLTGGAAAALAFTSSSCANSSAISSTPVLYNKAGYKKVRIGIVGGAFGAGFNFHEDPNCIVQAVSDLRQDRKERLMKVYKCNNSYHSLTDLLKDKDVDAVFIATPAPDHANHVIETLNAGKHVLCAVPLAMNLEDCNRVLNAVKRTGLTYMMAETSYYRQNAMSVRKMYNDGDFGTIFRTAAQYHHPGLEVLFFDENKKPTWRHGLPPMLYPTHCTAFPISVTGERLVRVSCIGWGDNSPLLKNNPYNNPFWNATAFFETDKGHPFKMEVDWRGALRGAERGEWEGSLMSFYASQGGPRAEKDVIVKYADKIGFDDAGFKHKEPIVQPYEQELWWKTDLLPTPMRHDSGHGGSHTFLSHEFIDALINNRKPAIDIYESLAYTVPGIIAHQSALKGGESMKVPVFDPGKK